MGERLGSGDGEREASMTRQMPFEPLPASVLFALVHGEAALIRVPLQNLTPIARMAMTKTPTRGMPSIGNVWMERKVEEVGDELRIVVPSPTNIA